MEQPEPVSAAAQDPSVGPVMRMTLPSGYTVEAAAPSEDWLHRAAVAVLRLRALIAERDAAVQPVSNELGQSADLTYDYDLFRLAMQMIEKVATSGYAYGETENAEQAQAVRQHLRREARGRVKIRTGVMQLKPTRVWAARPDLVEQVKSP